MRNVITELRGFIKYKLPDEAMRAWYDSLASEEQEEVVSYCQDVLREVGAAWNEFCERVGQESIERFMAGLQT